MSNEIAQTKAPEVLPALAPEAANPSQSRAMQLAELQSEAQFLEIAYGLAEKACGTAMVAQHFRGKPADGAIAIAYGSSLGWAWTKSLQDVYVVNGKPSIQAKEMRELMIRAGHTIEEVEVGPERVVLVGYRRGSDLPVTVEWTMEKARLAGLLSNKNYEKYPEHMLYARATTDLAKRLAPDALSGLGIVEEMQDVTADPVRRPAPKARGVAGLKQQLAAAFEPEPQPEPEPEPEPEQPSEPAATTAQIKKLNILIEQDGITDRDEKLAYLSSQVGRELASSKDLTKAECARLLDCFEESGDQA